MADGSAPGTVGARRVGDADGQSGARSALRVGRGVGVSARWARPTRCADAGRAAGVTSAPAVRL